MLPKVSIVTAMYNGEKYLLEFVDSMLIQTFDNFEFIIVDDGSTDNTITKLQ
jgi:glycosyltransferase involved in cell wall biosynthesis